MTTMQATDTAGRFPPDKSWWGQPLNTVQLELVTILSNPFDFIYVALHFVSLLASRCPGQAEWVRDGLHGRQILDQERIDDTSRTCRGWRTGKDILRMGQLSFRIRCTVMVGKCVLWDNWQGWLCVYGCREVVKCKAENICLVLKNTPLVCRRPKGARVVFYVVDWWMLFNV